MLNWWKTACAACVLCLAATRATAQGPATFTTLFNFDSTDGDTPSGLIQSANGYLYGTAANGGAYGYGTVFKISPSGTLSVLHSFDDTDGAFPFAPPLQAQDGNFYGPTYSSTNLLGTVFKITPGGTLTTLHYFNGADGASPEGALIQATDGNLYGTTSGGGTYGRGTVFRISTQGALTTLYSFCSQTNCTDGDAPDGALVQAADGNFYGTTFTGGGVKGGSGTVFKITPGGVLTTIHVFEETDGAYPFAGLIQASDGNLYGTTSAAGGPIHEGTVFRITLAGKLTTLYSFCTESGCPNGSTPYAPLMQGSDGNLYGTTYQGGSTCDCGTVFRITPKGALTSLVGFEITNGSFPGAGLIEAANGDLYGSTDEGGENLNCKGGCGTIFRLSLGLDAPDDPSQTGNRN